MSELGRVAECADSWAWKVRSHIWKVLSAPGSPRKEAKAGVLWGCQAEEGPDSGPGCCVDTGESV